MYVVKVVCVAKHGDDRSNASPGADEAPKTNNPVTRGRQRCPSVSKPATDPYGQVSESSLDNTLSRDERIPYRHREQGKLVTRVPETVWLYSRSSR